jgi:transposase-like protein
MSGSVFSAPHFHNEEAAYEFVEARLWPNGPVCPKCGEAERVGKLNGKSTRIGVRKCYSCRKPFTVKVGTIFEDSHIKMHVWLQAIHLMASSKKGISSNQLSRILGITMQSAWFLSHRIRAAMADLGVFGDSGPLGGENVVVGVDETYVGGKAKNRKSHVPPKAPVVSLVERDGKVRSFHVAGVNAANLRPIVTAHIDQRTYIMTDDSTVYPAITKSFAGHGTVNHSIAEYVRGGFWHTNTVESFFSILKRGVVGTYHHVSQAHLHRYLAEFDFRHNNRAKLGVDDAMRADNILAGVVGKRLTYQTARA